MHKRKEVKKMPEFQLGDKLNIDRGQDFIELKSKGEKVHLRFLPGTYYYDATHFVKKTDGGWDVFKCSRVMEDEKCDECEKYFDLIKQAKATSSEKKATELRKKANGHKATIRFYFPVLDRETEQAGIFKTSLSVRLRLEEEYSNGVEVLDYDYIITRTEKPGSDYYSLTRLDSKQIKKLTPKEVGEVKKASTWDVAEMVGGKESGVDFGTSELDEMVNPEDVEIDED